MGNYRPISILTCFSKILEKLIHQQMSKLLEKHNVLLPTQYAFQKNTSTTHALLDAVSNIFDQLNSKNYVGLLLLNFKKAFDTVSYEILFMKLDHYGIRGPCKNQRWS